MKKTIILIFTLALIFSCENDSEEVTGINKKAAISDRIDFENGSYEKLSLSSIEFLESKNLLDKNSFFYKKYSINELYNIKFKSNNKSYIGLDLSIEGSNLEGYKIKNYVIIHKLSNNKKFIYLQRDIIKENFKIVQFLDITNGNVMEYFLYNCTEKNYSDYQNKVNVNIGGLDKKHICYKTFDSCYKNTKNGLVQSPADEVACDWLPCATMAYSFCALASLDGYIQTGNNFVSGNCTSIL